MSERDDLGAGIYAALNALVILICLLAVLMLPASWFARKWLGLVGLVRLLVGVPILLRLAHRSRIREAVGRIGGTVVRT